MYVCICNAISEQDLIDDPNLRALCGTCCGKCLPLADSFSPAELGCLDDEGGGPLDKED